VADLEEEDENGTAVVKKTAKEMHVFPITRATILFQVIMVLVSIYWAMLLTNWGSPIYSAKNESNYNVDFF